MASSYWFSCVHYRHPWVEQGKQIIKCMSQHKPNDLGSCVQHTHLWNNRVCIVCHNSCFNYFNIIICIICFAWKNEHSKHKVKNVLLARMNTVKHKVKCNIVNYSFVASSNWSPEFICTYYVRKYQSQWCRSSLLTVQKKKLVVWLYLVESC